MSTFALPDFGEGLQEAEIVAWHVAEGDHVVADQPMLAVETEKAVIEIPSPQAGHVSKLLAKTGERVKVGAPIIEFEEGPHAESGTVVGQLTGPDAAPPSRAQAAAAPPAALSRVQSTSGSVRASPAVRARARELGVDLSYVAPSGPDHTITLADVQAAVPDTAVASVGEPLRGARRAMAVNVTRAWREVAHASVCDDADVDAWPPQEDVMCRLVRALLAGCKVEPALNAGFDPASLSLRHNVSVDLGIAIDSAEGLFVPVLRDAARGTPQDWRRQIGAFRRGVSERSLAANDLRGATISLSNFGSLGGRHASLIIVPPQVAILGAGRIVMQAAQAAGGITLHRTLPLSLTFDHRAITGGMAIRFLRAALADLEAAS